MPTIIHTKLQRSIITGAIPLLAIAFLSPAMFCLAVYADEGTSVTYSTPLLLNITDYSLDGDVTLDVNVAEINALEITLSTSNLLIDLTPKVTESSFGSDTLNILVGTSNSTGYTLTMQPFYNNTATTSLTRTESINNTLPAIDTINAATIPATFASTSDTATMNKWGYLLNATSLDVDKTIYNPILTTNRLNTSTEPVSNDPTTLTFAAKANSELPAGTYRATLKFTAVANPVGNNYNIVLNGNGGTIAGSETTTLSGVDTSVTLPAATYRTNYATLLGWSESATATTPTYTDEIALEEDITQTLYAVWSFNSGTLQNTSTSCGTNMVDARTGVSYLTANISGDCFMEQNLYLPLNINLYASDSNISDNVYSIAYDLTLGRSYTEAGLHEGTHTDNTYNVQGSWFNYCAASAGTICSDDVAADATQDICPKDWKLPTKAQFDNVASANRSNWKFYIGYFVDALQNTTAMSLWWSDTAYNVSSQWNLLYRYNNLNPGDASARDQGFSVRCVRK